MTHGRDYGGAWRQELQLMYFGYLSGGFKGKIVTLQQPVISLGTSDKCEVRFAATDKPCAPVHARIGYHQGHIVIWDLCPLVGMLVNSEVVNHHRVIGSRDVIQLGRGGPQVRFYLDRDVAKCPICNLPLYKKHMICTTCGQKVCLRCVDRVRQMCTFCAQRTGRW